jgi:hypothetical protein
MALAPDTANSFIVKPPAVETTAPTTFKPGKRPNLGISVAFILFSSYCKIFGAGMV